MCKPGPKRASVAGAQHRELEPHAAAIAQQVHDLDRPGLEPAHDRRLAGEADRPERRAQVDLAVGRLQHQAASGHQHLQPVEACVVGEGPRCRDGRAAEAPDLAVEGDVDRDAAAVLPRRPHDTGGDRAGDQEGLRDGRCRFALHVFRLQRPRLARAGRRSPASAKPCSARIAACAGRWPAPCRAACRRPAAACRAAPAPGRDG